MIALINKHLLSAGLITVLIGQVVVANYSFAVGFILQGTGLIMAFFGANRVEREQFASKRHEVLNSIDMYVDGKHYLSKNLMFIHVRTGFGGGNFRNVVVLARSSTTKNWIEISFLVRMVTQKVYEFSLKEIDENTAKKFLAENREKYISIFGEPALG